MKYLVAALLLVPVMAFTYTWDSWEDRCTDDYYTDFTIYSMNASYRSSSGIAFVHVEPRVDVIRYLPGYSSATFAGFERPLIPGFDYPSTIPLRASVNYSFFVPFEYSENEIFVRTVANTSDGQPRCSEAQWEVNDSNRVQDTNHTLVEQVIFNPATKKFQYNVTNLESKQVRMTFAVFTGTELLEASSTLIEVQGGSGDSISKSSKNQYDSFDVSSGQYEVYLVAATETKSFYKKLKLFEFYDFDLTLPELPEFRPGESYDATLVLKNTGSILDSYDITVDVPTGWEYSVVDPGSLDKGTDKELVLSYTVPELQVGSETLSINISSLNSGVTKQYDLDMTPEKLSTMEVSIRDISELKAYSTNNLSVVVIASGTVSPKMYYYVYTEPAILIRGGVGTMNVYIGEINKDSLSFDAGGSCAMSEANSMAFNAGRKMLMLGHVAYYLSSELSNTSVETLEQIKDILEAEKLKMTSEDATKLFSSAERLSLLIERIIEGWQDERSVEYFRSLREDLYLYNVDLDSLLADVGEDMSETCSSIDTVDLQVFAMDLETLQYREVPRSLPVTGPKVIELIGPSKLKAISGSSIFVDYKLKNNAGEAFEVDLEPSTDIIYAPAFVYLPADSTKDVEIRIRPPEYYEAEELQAFIEAKTRTYNLKFPLTLSIGTFDPEIIADREYAISPGEEDYFNITLRTGGLDDVFRFSVEGPSWITVPERVITKNGEAVVTVVASPPSSASGSEYVSLTAYPEDFPDYVALKSFDVFVSSEAQDLLVRVEEDEALLEGKADKLTEQQYLEASRYLRSARDDISTNEFNQAKLNLKRAENIIFSVSEEEGPGWTTYIIAAVLLVGAIVVFWKFLLPKIQGTPEAPEEEVI